MSKSDKPQTHRKLFENIKTIVYSKSETVSRISQRTFLGTDLETTIFCRIEHFMLELGNGFLFAELLG